MVRGDLADPESFRSHAAGIARTALPEYAAHGERSVANYELEVREPGSDRLVTILRWD